MLLIDNRGEVRSLPPHRAAVPFLRERFRHDLTEVTAWLLRCRQDLGFIEALRDESQRCLAWQPSAQHYPEAMIAAAVRAIADGLIGVASSLPDQVTLRFDRLRPIERERLRTAVFADLATAEQFVAAMLKTPEAVAAFEAALAHPEGRRHATTHLALPAGETNRRVPAGMAELAARAAALLASGWLGVVPRDAARQVLWLVWVEHAPPAVPLSAAPPPQAAPPPSQSQSQSQSPASAPASTLPNPPATVSDQAQTLIDAARDGVPFCEECARAAAARTAQAANA